MTRFIVFANRKGGCGKTTTTVNVAYALAVKGRKILVVDLDSQGHATHCLGHSPESKNPGIIQLMNGDVRFSDVVLKTGHEKLNIIPSSRRYHVETDDISMRYNEIRLLECLYDRSPEYDYLIFDPPSVNPFLVFALAASSEVYIPMPMHFLAMEGLAEMMRLIYKVNANWNPNLRLIGIIPTFYNSKTRICRQLTEDIVNNFGKEKLFSGIRMNISLAEAPGHRKTVIEYAPASRGAEDYITLAERIDAGR